MQRILRKALLPFFLFIYLFTAFIAYLPPSFTAKADSTHKRGDYACILEDGVFFYADPAATTPLFTIPATYYVQLLDYTPTYCRVEYQTDDTLTQQLVGYVATRSLTFIPYTPKRPYLQLIFSVDYRIENGTQNGDGFLTQITKTCAYYGDYAVGNVTYCYVLIDGSFGYIPKPATLSFEDNKEYADYLQTLNGSTSETTPKKENNTPAQIAILVTLCLLVPLIAALILKPKRDPFHPEE